MDDKQREIIEERKEFAAKFLQDFITDLEELQIKYSTRLPHNACYNVVIEALNENNKVITLFKQWRTNVNEI